jgi:hypothetical protein
MSADEICRKVVGGARIDVAVHVEPIDFIVTNLKFNTHILYYTHTPDMYFLYTINWMGGNDHKPKEYTTLVAAS